jgi:peptide/nickel transport system substrate-binding protein
MSVKSRPSHKGEVMVLKDKTDSGGQKNLSRRTLVRTAAAGAGVSAVSTALASPVFSKVSSPSTTGLQFQAQSEEVLVIGFHQDPTSLDPVSTTTAAFQSVTAATIEQLIVPNADGTDIDPWLATEWSWVDDLTLEFKLREDVTFSNGEPFNAESAAYSIDLLLAAEAYTGYTAGIDSAEAVDDLTLHVNLNTPGATALTALARGSYMYPAQYHAEVGA